MQRAFLLVLTGLALSAGVASVRTQAGQAPATAPAHASAARRLLVRDVMVIYGNTKPAFGPVDVVVEAGIITAVARPRASGDRRPTP